MFPLPCGIPVTAILDRLELDGWKAAPHDYKTQKNPFSQEDLDDNWQAKIYFIAALREIPLAKSEPFVEVVFWVLRHGKQKVVFETGKEDAVLAEIDHKVREILASPCTETRPSGLCQFCPVAGCHGKSVVRSFSRKQKSASVQEYRKVLEEIRSKKREAAPPSPIDSSIDIF